METEPGAHRSAAITGAGSGLGRSVALKLADKGYRVFGTAHATAEVNELHHASRGRVSLSLTDITDDEAVRTWARHVGTTSRCTKRSACSHSPCEPRGRTTRLK
jgi:NADP-dependent 3-hydroxy acid dehydrogenase YdfG